MCSHIGFYTLKHIVAIIAHWYELYFHFINIQTPTCYHDSEHQMKNVLIVPYTHKWKVGPISNHNNVQMNRYFRCVVSCNEPIFIYIYCNNNILSELHQRFIQRLGRMPASNGF